MFARLFSFHTILFCETRILITRQFYLYYRVMGVSAAYLPIDPQIPSALLNHLINTLHVRCIITHQTLLQVCLGL